MAERTPSGIACDRAGPQGGLPVVLIHAGVAAAVEANLDTWVDGSGREGRDVDPTVRDLVGEVQRRAFELTAGWDDVEERELEPAALDRLAEIRVPTLVLVGALDLDAIHDAVRRVADGIAGARLVEWANTAHLPSIERPDDFLAPLRDWLAQLEPTLP